MKKVIKVVFVVLCVGGTLNVPAQVKDTVYIGDSVAYPKQHENNKMFSIFLGKKVRATKKDKGKRAFIIYNTNAAGERKISKIYYAN